MNEKKATTISTKTGVGIILVAVALVFGISLMRSNALSKTEARNKVTSGEVVMFSTDTCNYCKKVRELFRQHDVAYLELNIDTSDKARALFQTLGGRGVPLTFIGEMRIEGYNKTALLSAINQMKQLR